MKKLWMMIILILLSAATLSSAAKSRWAFEAFFGAAWSISTPLSIHQYGEDRIYLIARYNNEPFKESPYYAWRISRWKRNRAWEFELVHHKIILSNRPQEVQYFAITHGYNLITVNRAWSYGSWVWRVGAGLVAAHPESTIREKSLSWGEGLDGFYITGPTVQAALEKKFLIFGRLFAVFEGKFTASYAVVPIQDGNAYAPNVALHGLFGLGYWF